ncbi:carboxylic ester hydrolase-like isoform X2 [Artemia franciscana]|uniref:carboxylic ester hydrolase-like isoform X2 n=1 Tax=Artemia franciscana TaxID=6661 RepID=UPI0032DB8D68
MCCGRSVKEETRSVMHQIVPKCAIFLCVLNFSFSVISSAGVVVNTKLGRVLGSVEVANQDGIVPNPDGTPNSGPRYYAAFKGIPYAKPPINERRWKDPLPYGTWEKDLDATRFQAGCLQWDRSQHQVVGSEDCLYLNIYVPSSSISPGADPQFYRQSYSPDFIQPRIVPLGQRGTLPVLFWIHGGAYMQGGSQLYGAEMLMRENAILVTFNYRLGVFGFLCSGDKTLPGNFGLFDTVAALQWVRQNIDDFGGDPNRITVFGESAGGAITHLLMASPLAKGLFQQAIFQSGSSLCEWSTEPNPREYFNILANSAGCPLEPVVSAVSCLKNKSSIELIKFQKDQLRHSFFPIRAAPVVDGNFRSQPFLPQHPRDLFASGNFNKVPTISGVTKDEGLLFYLLIHIENAARMDNPSFLEKDLLPNSLMSFIRNNSEHEATVRAVKRQYFPNGEFQNLNDFIPKYSKMLEDLLINSCMLEAQMLLTKTQLPHYAYVFSHREPSSPSYSAGLIDVVKRMGIDTPLLNNGVGHADDLLYLFKIPGLGFEYSAADMYISAQMTKMWANFATFGSLVFGMVSSLRSKTL